MRLCTPDFENKQTIRSPGAVVFLLLLLLFLFHKTKQAFNTLWIKRKIIISLLALNRTTLCFQCDHVSCSQIIMGPCCADKFHWNTLHTFSCERYWSVQNHRLRPCFLDLVQVFHHGLCTKQPFTTNTTFNHRRRPLCIVFVPPGLSRASHALASTDC